MKFTQEMLENLVDDINKLSKDEHIEIFKIIRKSTDKYTQNDNGLFVNLQTFDSKLLTEVYKFVLFCKDNIKKLKENEEIIKIEKEKMMSNTKTNSTNNSNNEYIMEENVNIDNNISDNKIYSNDIENNNDNDDNDDNDDINNDNNKVDTEKKPISLKRTRPKYTGTRAKIIRNYNKQNNSSIYNVIYNMKNIKDDKDENDMLDGSVSEDDM